MSQRPFPVHPHWVSFLEFLQLYDQEKLSSPRAIVECLFETKGRRTMLFENPAELYGRYKESLRYMREHYHRLWQELKEKRGSSRNTRAAQQRDAENRRDNASKLIKNAIFQPFCEWFESEKRALARTHQAVDLTFGEETVERGLGQHVRTSNGPLQSASPNRPPVNVSPPSSQEACESPLGQHVALSNGPLQSASPNRSSVNVSHPSSQETCESPRPSAAVCQSSSPCESDTTFHASQSTGDSEDDGVGEPVNPFLVACEADMLVAEPNHNISQGVIEGASAWGTSRTSEEPIHSGIICIDDPAFDDFFSPADKATLINIWESKSVFGSNAAEIKPDAEMLACESFLGWARDQNPIELYDLIARKPLLEPGETMTLETLMGLKLVVLEICRQLRSAQRNPYAMSSSEGQVMRDTWTAILDPLFRDKFILSAPEQISKASKFRKLNDSLSVGRGRKSDKTWATTAGRELVWQEAATATYLDDPKKYFSDRMKSLKGCRDMLDSIYALDGIEAETFAIVTSGNDSVLISVTAVEPFYLAKIVDTYNMPNAFDQIGNFLDCLEDILDWKARLSTIVSTLNVRMRLRARMQRKSNRCLVKTLATPQKT